MRSQHPDARIGLADAPVSLSLALERMAAEAIYWSGSIDALERQLASAPSYTASASYLQTLDFARQGLQGLGTVLLELATQVDPAAACELSRAVAKVGMRSQAERLTGMSSARGSEAETDLWGVNSAGFAGG